MFGFFWEMYQQNRIQDAHDAASRARSDASTRSRELESRVESLTLTVMGMWSLLEERLGVTEQELADRVREIDLRDGKLDGKAQAPPVACTACGRNYSSRRPRCIYCGEPTVPAA